MSAFVQSEKARAMRLFFWPMRMKKRLAAKKYFKALLIDGYCCGVLPKWFVSTAFWLLRLKHA